MGGDALEDLRLRIDEVDGRIIELLRERLRLCTLIGEVKLREGLPVRDAAREAEVLARAGEFAEVFKAIIKLCREAQEGLRSCGGD